MRHFVNVSEYPKLENKKASIVETITLSFNLWNQIKL